MQRRAFVELACGVLAASPLPGLRHLHAPGVDRRLAERCGALERRVRGRLGVAALDVAADRATGYRAHEQFPMCSTFKLLLAARILVRVDRSEERLDRVIRYSASDLLAYAPVTRRHLAEGGMTVAALIEAALEYSDNTAANLLLGTIGGPGGVTTFVRRLGDDITRLDRLEPELNSAVPGDPRDTTAPRAMVVDMRRVLLGDVLTARSRGRLLAWLEHNTTGGDKIRAGVPATWRAGDKTGSGGYGSTNDVAILWPRPEAPILVAAYLTETSAPAPDRNAALAQVGRIVAEWAMQRR